MSLIRQESAPERDDFIESIRAIGCGNHNCCISGFLGGIGTNGGCHCLDEIKDYTLRRKIREVLRLYTNEIKRLRKNNALSADEIEKEFYEASKKFSW